MLAYLMPGIVMIVGIGVACQGPVNAIMAKSVGGPLAAATVSVAVSTIALGLIVALMMVFQGQRLQFGAAPLWVYLTGGLVGAAFVTSLLLGSQYLGAGTVIALSVAGQMIASLFLDKFGAFDLAVRELSLGRIMGAVLLICGVVMIRFL